MSKYDDNPKRSCLHVTKMDQNFDWQIEKYELSYHVTNMHSTAYVHVLYEILGFDLIILPSPAPRSREHEDDTIVPPKPRSIPIAHGFCI